LDIKKSTLFFEDLLKLQNYNLITDQNDQVKKPERESDFYENIYY